MTKEKKIILIIVGLAFLSAWIYFGRFFFGGLRGLCENKIINSVESPDKSKKVIVFVRSCGATMPWVTSASILRGNEYISNKDFGNIINLDTNHGLTRPTSEIGWPIINPEWISDSELILNISDDGLWTKSEYFKYGIRVIYKKLSPK